MLEEQTPNETPAPETSDKSTSRAHPKPLKTKGKEKLSPRHKLFSEKVIQRTIENREPILSGAYKDVYSDAKDPRICYVGGSRLFKRQDVRIAVEQGLENQGLSLNYLLGRLKGLIGSDNEGIALEATKTGLKLHDAFPSDDRSQIGNVEHLEVTINVNRTSQIDGKPDNSQLDTIDIPNGSN